MKGRLYGRWNKGKEDCMEDGKNGGKIIIIKIINYSPNQRDPKLIYN